MKSGGFHEIREIRRISPVKSGGFHEIREIRRISWNPWNPADFTQISPVKSTHYKSKCFSKKLFSLMNAGWGLWPRISPWNLVDFTCEIQQSSPRFHLWNPPKIIKASVLAKTLQFDEWRVGAMTKDFMKFTLKSGGFHPWNLVDFTQISPVKSTQNYKSKCFSKNSSVWWMQGGGYDQGFHEICWISHEIHMKSTGFQNYELLHDDQV